MRATVVGYVFAVLVLLGELWQIGYCSMQLPDPIAVNFDVHGNVTKLSAKTSFLATDGLMLLVLFCTIPLFHWMTLKLPDSYFGIPHHEYWFASKRNLRTRGMIFHLIQMIMISIMIVHCSIFELVFWANLGHPELMRMPVWVIPTIFVAFVISVSLLFVLRFERLED